MKTIKTEYGYKIRKEKDSDIEIYNEDKKLVAALTKKDLNSLLEFIK